MSNLKSRQLYNCKRQSWNQNPKVQTILLTGFALVPVKSRFTSTKSRINTHFILQTGPFSLTEGWENKKILYTQQYLKPQLKTADIYRPTGSKPFVSSIKQQCHFLLKYINRLHQYSRTVHSSPFWPHPEQHMGEDSLLRKYSRQNVLNLCWHNKTFIGQKDNILSLKKPHRKDKSHMTNLKYPNCFSLTAMRFSEKQFSSLLLDFFFFLSGQKYPIVSKDISSISRWPQNI